MQSTPDIFDESRFVMTFLTILVTNHSFTLVLEDTAGKEIPNSSRLEFLEKFLAKKKVLSEAE